MTKTHAIETALSFFNSIMNKDFIAFQKSFHPDPNVNFVDILPDGRRIFNSTDLIKIHHTFFNNAHTCFKPIKSYTKFSETNFEYVFESSSFFQVGVDVEVTKPVVLSELENELELETIYNHISLTLAFDEDYQQWFSQMITNTIIDK